MKRKFLKPFFYATILLLGFSITACDDDDDDDNNPTGASVFAIENINPKKDFVQSGTMPANGAGAESITIKFNAAKGQRLMFATMYGNSNDIFFAPENPGIPLYNSQGQPMVGDVSSYVKLWDNGTRMNQAPGSSVTHPGTAQIGVVKMINGTDEQGHTYRPASELMRLELAYNRTHSEFTLTITNTSMGTANETPFSPGVWAISNMMDGSLVNTMPFFNPNTSSSMELTKLAEMGSNQELATKTMNNTGVITGLSPVLVVIYTGTTNPIFEEGKLDGGKGLKNIAQKGDVNMLKEYLQRLGGNVRGVYVAGTAPIASGKMVEVRYDAKEGDNIAFVTMFGSSNDWFFGNNTTISANVMGDITSKTSLFDDGTAVSQYPGAGNGQAMFGGTSDSESKVITKVEEGYIPNVVRINLR